MSKRKTILRNDMHTNQNLPKKNKIHKNSEILMNEWKLENQRPC